jgi:uncharacterized membrane-anchored protein YitT (DUF2179 family)
LLLGTALAGFAFAVFQVPYNLAAGGLGGVGLIVNNFTGWPVGLLYFLLSIPLVLLGSRELGGWPFIIKTGIAAGLFSAFTDLFVYLMPRLMTPFPPTEDVLLSAVYGGILGGIGGGLVFRSASTMGGTGVIGRWIQRRTGQPLSQVYLYTDGTILLAMGLVFGWTVTLYGLLMLFLNGLASDYTLEGPSSTRIATIVTNHPQQITRALIAQLDRGASYWEITGGYTGRQHYLVTCTLARSQVAEVRQLVAGVDPDAFVTISVGQRALGRGFQPLRE